MLDEELKKEPNEDQSNGGATNDSQGSGEDQSNTETPEVDSKNNEQDSGVVNSNSSESDAAGDGGNEQQSSHEDAASDKVPTSDEVIAELNEKNLRLVAEMENLRRRTEKEVRESRQFAVASFAREILQVSDNLMRALQTIPEETRENADSNLKSLLDGVEMTERELQNVLSKHNISKVDPKGEKFDPNFHQAMFEVTDSDAANNTVVEVVQSGYKIGDRVLRPALVGVAKASEKKNGE